VDPAVLLWIGLAVVVLVFLDLLFVEVRRAAREAQRLMRRLEAYADSPLVGLLAASERDVERINAAIEAVAPLQERGRRAVAVLRAYLPKGISPE
jgi:hypothetical protein